MYVAWMLECWYVLWICVKYPATNDMLRWKLLLLSNCVAIQSSKENFHYESLSFQFIAYITELYGSNSCPFRVINIKSCKRRIMEPNFRELREYFALIFSLADLPSRVMSLIRPLALSQQGLPCWSRLLRFLLFLFLRPLRVANHMKEIRFNRDDVNWKV